MRTPSAYPEPESPQPTTAAAPPKQVITLLQTPILTLGPSPQEAHCRALMPTPTQPPVPTPPPALRRKRQTSEYPSYPYHISAYIQRWWVVLVAMGDTREDADDDDHQTQPSLLRALLDKCNPSGNMWASGITPRRALEACVASPFVIARVRRVIGGVEVVIDADG